MRVGAAGGRFACNDHKTCCVGAVGGYRTATISAAAAAALVFRTSLIPAIYRAIFVLSIFLQAVGLVPQVATATAPSLAVG